MLHSRPTTTLFYFPREDESVAIKDTIIRHLTNCMICVSKERNTSRPVIDVRSTVDSV